jgi:predicted ATPase/DNA-binding CsgD family transcriptional regulator/DNA-binding XRE family transcriptional regulator
MNDEPFAVWFKRRRQALDLTQRMLAQQVECSVETIRKIEAGKLRPSRRLLDRLVDALAIPDAERAAFVQSARPRPEYDTPALPQLAAPALPSLPPIRQLPVTTTALIGRTAELAALRTLLLRSDVRLLTLTGAPGIGKTRLVIQAAADVGDAFADGVAFIPLAPISDANLVIPAITQALGVREAGKQPLIDALIAFLREKQFLLALDNFEQVLAAAPLIVRLLESAPRLTLLLTSRAVLRAPGEHEFVVPPLALPDVARLPGTQTLTEYAAVELFVLRSRAAQQAFALTEANAAAVAEICVRLDGAPLAIELAAARSKILPPQALLRRLDQRLTLLSGAADSDARHRTLHAAIAWSYDLLSSDEQTLFRRLGVFVGGCRLEAAEAVCSAEQQRSAGAAPPADTTIATLNRMAALVDQSLLQQTVDPDDEPRFTMLETIRVFALEQLEASGEAEEMRRRHAEYFLRVAEEVRPRLRGPDQKAWLDRVEADRNNLLTALAWSQTDNVEETFGLRLAAALYHFWYIRGYYREGRAWFAKTLRRGADADPSWRALVLSMASQLTWEQSDAEEAQALAEASLALARPIRHKDATCAALNTLCWIAYAQGDISTACERLEEALALHRETNSTAQIAYALNQLGYLAERQGNYAKAAECYEESLALYRQLNHERGIGTNLSGLAGLMQQRGEYRQARALYEESLAIARKLEHPNHIANGLNRLGRFAVLEGNIAQAMACFEESLALYKELGNQLGVAVVQLDTGAFYLLQGDVKRSTDYLEQSLTAFRELGYKVGIVGCLIYFSSILRLQSAPERALCLLSAATALLEAIGETLDLFERIDYDRHLTAARAQLTPAAFDAAWAEGQQMTMEQAIELALEVAREAQSAPPQQPVAALTPRETDVLRLVAEGLTNREIAERLIISARTVNAHLNAIYAKLGVASRAAATRYAVEQGITAPTYTAR